MISHGNLHRWAEDLNVIREIFWSHLGSIELANTFNIVLLIESIYKTNRNRLALVEAIGVTSTKMNFSIAFAYFERKKIDNFVWVLEKMKGMFMRPDDRPQVILTRC